ncbi:FecR family protein [Sphingobacterium puteale]|uniref:FecR family protein n=1 Tax=Sphingobacterium puteale TaxID=2420510 RepID=A0A420W0B2_9SPHI|nr:FecR domain-containing protein [Sphingobacterium puteale]RKO72005.1 FecR family protein [Sphingobacterium puteale]
MSERKRHVRTVLKDLLDRYISGRTNLKEQQFVEKLYDAIDKGGAEHTDLDRIGEEIREGVQKHIEKRPIPQRLHRTWYAAASVIILLGTFISYWVNKQENRPSTLYHATHQNPALIIGNQKRFDLLDTLPPGSHYTIINEEKVLALGAFPHRTSNGKLRIENPSRQVFSVLLDDSTQVWLNYMATLELDPNFNKSNRSVRVTGEVFFDVYKQYTMGKRIPFSVHSSLQTIEVLGTKFNVNASDGVEENVLLSEGSIRLTHNRYGTQVLIKPGQQAFVEKDKPKILLIQSRNIEKANAWRKGLFYFDSERLAEVVLEFEQWYGTDIRIDPVIADLPITGMISRYEDIEEVLNIIKMTNNINYSKKKGIIYVTR